MPKKKRYIVVPRTKKAILDGLDTTKGKFNFGTGTARFIDESLANEIDTQHGLKGSGDVWVERDENLEWHEHHDKNTDGRKVSIHHYTFAGVDTSHLKPTRDNGYVWVYFDGKQKRITRQQAEEEGLEIVENKVRNHRNPKHGKSKVIHGDIAY